MFNMFWLTSPRGSIVFVEQGVHQKLQGPTPNAALIAAAGAAAAGNGAGIPGMDTLHSDCNT